MRNKLAILMLTLISISFVHAHEEEDFLRAEEIIKQKTSCDELSENDLELIGDYYMEQMHPGELHEIMDERMGGEGSESLRQVHINIAMSFYCGERNAVPMQMMNMMMGRSNDGFGTMGMMRGYPSSYYRESNYPMFLFSWIFFVLLISIIILLTVLLARRKNGAKRKFRR